MIEKENMINEARKFIQQKIAPIAAQIDENETFPFETMKELGKCGYLGIQFPVEYGGSGLDTMMYLDFIKEVASVCASTAITLVAHSSLTCNMINKYGTDEQKQKYMCPLIKGEKIGAFALTESSAGSDSNAIETTAVWENDAYVLNGKKSFITNATVADTFVVAAKTNPEERGLGISIFIVEKDMEGVRSGKKEKKLGVRGSDTGELILDHVRVKKENMIGIKNFGFKVLHGTLTYARIGMAALAIGIAQGAMDQSIEYTKERQQFGKNINQFQLIKNMIANMEMNISAGNLLIEKAARLVEEGKDAAKEAAEAKLFASEAATQITKDAIQIYGGRGFSKDLPLERFYRDAKITEIGDGTSEILRILIANEVIRHKKGTKGDGTLY